jgi:hypothetical protein
MAGVVRAAVSNWRRRYPDFPKPVGGSSASPVFSWVEVEAWLKETGKASQLATAGGTDTGTQRIDIPPRAGAQYAVLRPRARKEMADRAVADLTRGELLARVMASLLPRSTLTAQSPDVGDSGLPVVIDPACAEASLLLAVADRFGDRVRLAGQEIREKATAAAALNLRTSAHGVAYEVHTGDSLRDNRLSGYLGGAAGVVCEPPFDRPEWPSAELTTDRRWEFGIPAPRDAELAWVQHCYAHLRPRGVAVVAVSPRTCIQFSGQHIRAALVRSGVLRDVIALPAGMSSVSGTDAYLWVLRRPYGAPDHAAVRMVDLSGLGDPAYVPHEFAAWERLLEDGDPGICRAVPRLELLDGDASLLPSRRVATRAQAGAKDLADVTARLQALYARVGQGLPRFEAPESPVRYTQVTIGELERGGALTIQSRDATPLPGDLLLRTLGRPPTVATGTAADDDGVAQVVEIDQSRLDPYFVAGFLRNDACSLPVANTLGALSRDDLRRCRVPRMPVAEQRRYGDAFRRLRELDDALTALARLSTSVIDQMVNGLTTGAVVPGGPIMKTADDADANESETRTP